jgi:hypothetical protein
MENYESELFMSQENYASIDFTLLDRPNNKYELALSWLTPRPSSLTPFAQQEGSAPRTFDVL